MKSDTFCDLKVFPVKIGPHWSYVIDNRRVSPALMIKRYGIPRGTLAGLRQRFPNDQEGHARAINDWLWKKHCGYSPNVGVAHTKNGRVKKSSYKPLPSKSKGTTLNLMPTRVPVKKIDRGYCPHDPSTYMFYIDGKYHLGSDRRELVPVKLRRV